MDQKKKEALKELGVSDETLTGLIGTVEQTEKAADEAGIRYKDADPILAALKAFIGATVKEALEGATVETTTETVTTVEVEEKAAPVEEEIVAEAPAVEEQADGAMVDEPMEEESGPTLSPEDADLIRGLIREEMAAGLAPLAGLLDIEKKISGHVQSMMGQYTATKDAEAAQTKAKVESIDQRLKELEGDQPAVKPTRASQSPDTVINDTALLAAVKASSNGAGPFDDIISNLGLGPQN